MQSVRNRLSENDTKFIFRIICCPYKAPQPLLEVAFFTWLWPLLVFFCEYLILPLFYKCECVSGKKVLYKSLFCGSFCWVKYRNWNIAIKSFPLHSQKERYKTVPFKVQVAVTGVVPWRVQCCTSSQRYNIVPSSFVPFKGQFCTSRNICTHCNEGKKVYLIKSILRLLSQPFLFFWWPCACMHSKKQNNKYLG